MLTVLKKQMNEQRFFWIKATAAIRKMNYPFCYMSCNSCNRSTSATNAGETFFCRFCRTTNAIAKSRARVQVQLQDSTGNLTASLIGELAEEFLQCPADKLMTLSELAEDLEKNIRMTIDEEYVYYLKAVQPEQSFAEAARPVMSQSSTIPYKYEIV